MAVLKAGEVDAAGNWLDPDVMARYMEDALPKSPDPEDSGKLGRRQFLIAISTGVLDYLRLHQGNGFVVHTVIGSDDHTGTLELR
jgi:hypothetical protein